MAGATSTRSAASSTKCWLASRRSAVRTAQAMLARHALDPVPSLRTVRSAVPLPVEHAITKALAKVPADRFATADEFMTALEGAEGAAGIPPRKAVLRWPLLGAAAVAVLALAAGYALRRSAKTVPSSPEAVAILPFRTAGASHELAWLREGMVDLLSIKLGSEGGLRTAEPASVLSAWRRAAGSEGTVISPDAALEVARRVGSGRLIDGSVVGTPEHLTITATMLTLPDGRSTAHASAAGPVRQSPGAGGSPRGTLADAGRGSGCLKAPPLQLIASRDPRLPGGPGGVSPRPPGRGVSQLS